MKTILLSSLLILSSSVFAADLAKGKETYDRVCSTCHGVSGLGDGPVGAALPADQKPSNFQVAKFKYASDDAKMKDVILKGGAAFGLSPLMAAQPQLSDGELNDVIAYVHSLKK
jgi:cytochrome c6